MGGDPYLKALENRSVYIIRDAYWRYRGRMAVLWSMGKDSTTMLQLVRKSFLGRVPVPVIHIDTSYKFQAIYQFRDSLTREWGLDLRVATNAEALAEGMAPEKGRLECCHALKTEALKGAMARHGLKALLLAIRRDEHLIRAKERCFSPRGADFRWDYQDQPLEMWGETCGTAVEDESHVRVHPMLHWREIDIWRYIRQEGLPMIGLYFAKDGRRYRSIGCECCCESVPSQARTIDEIVAELQSTRTAERAGRAQDKEKEYMMQKLRSLGYM